ncbi:MAG: hypothetical protein M1812_004907 [Candelaria pacifica]|nr:MAG: hypothetical protein M1812_004907 [Candelaria pacifica]
MEAIDSMDFEDKLLAMDEYSACDVRRQVSPVVECEAEDDFGASDISPRAPYGVLSIGLVQQDKVIAPASTVLFVPKDYEPSEEVFEFGIPQSNIPPGSHWVDLTEKGTVVVVSQPEGQKCAVLGEIMAARMRVLGAEGVVVDGRVRDLEQLRSNSLPVWSRGKSTVGVAAEAKPYGINVAVKVGDVVVEPGDIIFGDPPNGVVSIPSKSLDEVLVLLPKLAAADYRIKEDVKNGCSVVEAFEQHRQGL